MNHEIPRHPDMVLLASIPGGGWHGSARIGWRIGMALGGPADPAPVGWLDWLSCIGCSARIRAHGGVEKESFFYLFHRRFDQKSALFL